MVDRPVGEAPVLLSRIDSLPAFRTTSTTHDSRPTTRWQYLGRVDYRDGLRLQQQARDRVRAGGDESLLLLEHPPVYTLGRSAEEGDVVAPREWLESRGVEVFESDRGGQVTYHGPGQIVGYPILDLSGERDIRRYVHRLMDVLVATLADFGVEARPRHRQSEIGVWVAERKIASLGVHISRWITTHGFALNVSTDLSYFEGIVPCGLDGVRMTSIEVETGTGPELAEVARRLVAHFGAVMRRELATE